MNTTHVSILGTRGIPAAHGGFETFTERLAPYLVSKGHKVTVYCQRDLPVGDPGDGDVGETEWEGVRLVTIGVSRPGAIGTMIFDWRCIRHAMREHGSALVLGYNTAIFLLPLRFLTRRTIIVNMDGIEWKRGKWSLLARVWFYLNDRAGSHLAHQLIADHPEIARYLARKRRACDIAMIPYGADVVADQSEEAIAHLGVRRHEYVVSIARIEPENSILEMVTGFSMESRNFKFVVLGRLDPDNYYHSRVMAAAGPGVIFPGAIYAKAVVASLRYNALAYCHGHTVGGTNPSLVEALGAGSAVIAHDNKYNRWTAGLEQLYFSDPVTFSQALQCLVVDRDAVVEMRVAAMSRHKELFGWDGVLKDYEQLMMVTSAS
jgi:glycosyltransferase involved in cell wall biosynthesis